MAFDSAQEIGQILQGDLYASATPQVDGLRQVIDTLKEKVQPLSPAQVQAVGYLMCLAKRPIHKDKKIYDDIITHVIEQRHNVHQPGFFIRLIEATTGGAKYVPSDTMPNMSNEREGKK